MTHAQMARIRRWVRDAELCRDADNWAALYADDVAFLLAEIDRVAEARIPGRLWDKWQVDDGPPSGSFAS